MTVILGHNFPFGIVACNFRTWVLHGQPFLPAGGGGSLSSSVRPRGKELETPMRDNKDSLLAHVDY